MDADIIEEEELFRAIDRSAARVLVIGRRAMVAIGIPVLTADYICGCIATTRRRSTLRSSGSG